MFVMVLFLLVTISLIFCFDLRVILFYHACSPCCLLISFGMVGIVRVLGFDDVLCQIEDMTCILGITAIQSLLLLS